MESFYMSPPPSPLVHNEAVLNYNLMIYQKTLLSSAVVTIWSMQAIQVYIVSTNVVFMNIKWNEYRTRNQALVDVCQKIWKTTMKSTYYTSEVCISIFLISQKFSIYSPQNHPTFGFSCILKLLFLESCFFSHFLKLMKFLKSKHSSINLLSFCRKTVQWSMKILGWRL